MPRSSTDAADFSIESATGVIRFAAVPNWSSPADANTDTIYEFTVRATNTSTGTKDQHVKIFVYPKNSVTGNEVAQQLGADIDGAAAGDNSGNSVSLSADGQVMAIGATSNDGNGSNSGHVREYNLVIQLTITGLTAANKDYDGTTETTVSAGELQGVITGDAVGVYSPSYTFASAGVGTGIAVSSKESYILTGSAAGNYTLTPPTSALTVAKGIQIDVLKALV